MLEQRIQQFTDQTECQKESNEDWKQGLEENLFKLIKVKQTAKYQNYNIKKNQNVEVKTLGL